MSYRCKKLSFLLQILKQIFDFLVSFCNQVNLISFIIHEFLILFIELVF